MGNPASDAHGAIVPVAIYTRVSTDNQLGRRVESCESQAAICREFIRQHAAQGWHEIACYTDEAYSGGTMNRPGMRALQCQIETGEVKVVVIYKLERVLRSTDEWTPFRSFLQKHGSRLESATEDLSEATPLGRFKNNILVSAAEYERLNTAEKTRAKMQEQAKRGLWNGGNVPYGYDYDQQSQTLRPHLVEAAVVRRIFDQAARLVSLTDMANALNAEGLRTKERVRRRRDGTTVTVGKNLFRCDGLRLIIQNPIYRGIVRFAGSEYPAKHDRLISPEVWEKANAAVVPRERAADARLQIRDAQHHLLKGLAFCGGCARALIPHDSGKKDAHGKPYRYYDCGRVIRERQIEICSVGRLSADALERAVVAFLDEVGRHPAVISSAVEASQTLKKKDRPALLAELEPIQRSLENVGKQLRNCVQAVAVGGVEVMGDTLTQRVNELRAERQRLLIAREQKRQEVAGCDTTRLNAERIQQSIEKFGTLLPTLPAAEQKELVQLFVERVEVRKALGKPAVAGRRLLELRIRLHLPRLVEGMEQKVLAAASGQRVGAPFSQRGFGFAARVDFTDAARGEVTIVAPIQRTVQLGARVQPNSMPAAQSKEHPIRRALEWHELLKKGKVQNRLALARREGLTPGTVTKILKLVQLIPEIREFLAKLSTPQDVWRFNASQMAKIAELPERRQRTAFAQIQHQHGIRIG